MNILMLNTKRRYRNLKYIDGTRILSEFRICPIFKNMTTIEEGYRAVNLGFGRFNSRKGNHKLCCQDFDPLLPPRRHLPTPFSHCTACQRNL